MAQARLPEHVALPKRLRALDAYLSQFPRSEFADWEFERVKPLAMLFPAGEADIIEAVRHRFMIFAGDFAGGLLALELGRTDDVERAPVVAFDSEGGVHVLGTTFDDFLALIAADQPDAYEDSWAAGEELRRWILDAGVALHSSAGARLGELGPVTREFRSRFSTALREASRRVRPDEPVDHVLIFGERIGEISLGQARAEVDGRWGTPDVPEWGRRDDRVLALYPDQPFAIEFDALRQCVTSVTLYAGRHRAITRDGTDPMFMTTAEAAAWLEAGGFSVEQGARELRAPEANLRLTMAVSRGGRDVQPWVEAIALVGG